MKIDEKTNDECFVFEMHNQKRITFIRLNKYYLYLIILSNQICICRLIAFVIRQFVNSFSSLVTSFITRWFFATIANLQRTYNEGTTTLLRVGRGRNETFLTNFNTENTMTTRLVRKKMLFVCAKNGLYYLFLSNTNLEQNEAKFRLESSMHEPLVVYVAKRVLKISE